MAATIKQIAKICNVSTATVSKALNNAPDIGADTAKKIRQTAKKIGYYPNSAARALKTNRSYNIGILFTESGGSGAMIGGLVHEYFAEVLSSFQREAELSGYDSTFITHNIGGTSMSYLEHCKYRNFDGIMVAGVNFATSDVSELIGSDIPIVTIDHISDYHSSVIVDNVESIRDLVYHAYEMGHRKIAYIHGQKVAVTKYRLASFYRTCKELGLYVPDEYVQEARFHDPESCAEATRKILSLSERPTCIMFPDDFSYSGGVYEIEKRGLSIPDDISTVGYDGIYLSQIYKPRLTTLKQDTSLIGKEAARLLIKAMKSPKTYLPEHIVIPGKLIYGNSVKQI